MRKHAPHCKMVFGRRDLTCERCREQAEAHWAKREASAHCPDQLADFHQKLAAGITEEMLLAVRSAP